MNTRIIFNKISAASDHYSKNIFYCTFPSMSELILNTHATVPSPLPPPHFVRLSARPLLTGGLGGRDMRGIKQCFYIFICIGEWGSWQGKINVSILAVVSEYKQCLNFQLVCGTLWKHASMAARCPPLICLPWRVSSYAPALARWHAPRPPLVARPRLRW